MEIIFLIFFYHFNFLRAKFPVFQKLETSFVALSVKLENSKNSWAEINSVLQQIVKKTFFSHKKSNFNDLADRFKDQWNVKLTNCIGCETIYLLKLFICFLFSIMATLGQCVVIVRWKDFNRQRVNKTFSLMFWRNGKEETVVHIRWMLRWQLLPLGKPINKRDLSWSVVKKTRNRSMITLFFALSFPFTEGESWSQRRFIKTASG